MVIYEKNGNREITVMDQSVSITPAYEKSKYGTVERVFAFASFIFGYIVLKTFIGNEAGAGAFCAVLLAVIGTAVYFTVKGAEQRLLNYLYLCGVALFSTVYILSDNGFIKFLSTVFVFFALTFYMYFTAGSGQRRFIDDMFVFDLITRLNKYIQSLHCLWVYTVHYI